VSALRIATTYDYPALRAYAIEHLEKAELSAIERIKIAREFKLASWEEPAYLELCERDETITMEEVGVLGLEAFVHVAGIREKEQRRRGKEVDARGQGRCLAGADPRHSGPANTLTEGDPLPFAEVPTRSSDGSEPPLINQGEEGGTTTRTDGPGMFARVVICL
jgi:hypothetical protein